MEHLVRGIADFQTHVFPQQKALFAQLASSQSPEVLLLTCADSRIDPNLITQTKPGDLFICRNAGNVVPPHVRDTGGVTATIEYAVAVLQVQHIVVCGHSNCGAMRALSDLSAVTGLPHVKEWLGHCQAAAEITKARYGHCGPATLEALSRENVLVQLNNLRTHPVVAAGLAIGSLEIHGWYYDIESGEVQCFCPRDGEFKPVAERYAALTARHHFSKSGSL